MSVFAFIQARCSSSRFPQKVLKPLSNQPMILFQIERVQRASFIDQIVLLTSTDVSDNPLEQLCQENDILYFRGSLDNVIERFYKAQLQFPCNHIVRLTGDCPLIDPILIDQVIETHLQQQNDYTSNCLEPTYPDGLDVEIFTANALNKAMKNAYLFSEKEHVTPFIYKHPEQFKVQTIYNQSNESHYRLTVDHPKDYIFIQKIVAKLQANNMHFGFAEILKLLKSEPKLSSEQAHYARNEGYQYSLRKDTMTSYRYQQSEQWLKHAEHSIPTGSQTFSKSPNQLPFGVSPYFAESAQGAYLNDIDGNQYLDFVNALAAITLGYNHPIVTEAVNAQLKKGTIFSLNNRLEAEVAEYICTMVPCAEQVRFAKNGSDATSAAIRLARAETARDFIACCGYHGWHDWYIATTTKNAGIPKRVQDLSVSFQYNNISSLQKLIDQYPQQIAAVILEPMNLEFPQNNFLSQVKTLCRQHDIVLIFDETVTGFRFDNGGAQAYFEVTPDLATFGKGIANGYPLSVVCGSKELMQGMSEIFFSGTFGGECLSLAAAKTVLELLSQSPILQEIAQTGSYLYEQVNTLLEKKQANEIFSIQGHPSWSFFISKSFEDLSIFEIKSFYMQECFEQGIFSLGSHNLSHAHTFTDIDKLIKTYEILIDKIQAYGQHGDKNKLLKCKPISPLFKIR